MHTEIPDALLVPGADPLPLNAPPPAAAQAPVFQDPEEPADSNPAESGLEAAIQEKESQQVARDMLHRRKRRVALLAVLVVALAVPAIVLALLLG
ncbi:hypothetical protein [Arthrobacter sp. TE12232]